MITYFIPSIKINKPFTVAPTSLPPPSFFTAANPIHLAQGSSNLAQHHFKMHSTQGGKDLPNEITQKASKTTQQNVSKQAFYHPKVSHKYIPSTKY